MELGLVLCIYNEKKGSEEEIKDKANQIIKIITKHIRTLFSFTIEVELVSFSPFLSPVFKSLFSSLFSFLISSLVHSFSHCLSHSSPRPWAPFLFLVISPAHPVAR